MESSANIPGVNPDLSIWLSLLQVSLPVYRKEYDIILSELKIMILALCMSFSSINETLGYYWGFVFVTILSIIKDSLVLLMKNN